MTYVHARMVGRGIAALALASVIAAPVAVNASTAGAQPPAGVSSSTILDANIASSVPGGKITRKEVLSRAEYWRKHQPGPYNQRAYSLDPERKHKYRRDCSGYVSMAWHTKGNYWTGNLSKISTQISRKSLKPGDILNYSVAHVLIFAKWDNTAHTRFTYYSFGSTPVKMRHAGINDRTFDGHPNGKYVARRYHKIV